MRPHAPKAARDFGNPSWRLPIWQWRDLGLNAEIRLPAGTIADRGTFELEVTTRRLRQNANSTEVRAQLAESRHVFGTTATVER